MMKTNRDITAILGQTVHVLIDRPLGSVHPRYPNLVYEVNYGYVPGILGGDGEEQDAYILGIDEPLAEFDGVIIAVLERLNDNESKWIVASANTVWSDEDILQKIHFQEKYFSTRLLRKKRTTP